jgi:hypothetical protein
MKRTNGQKIILTVKSMLYGENTDPIAMSEETHMDVLATDDGIKTIPKHDTTEPSNTQMAPSNEATSGVRPSTRPKEPPNTMLKDFLW